MENRRFEMMVMDHLHGEMDDQGKKEFEELIGKDPELLDELEDLKELWENMGNMESPNPSQQMDHNFYRMLDSMTKEAGIPGLNKITGLRQALFQMLGAPQLAFGILLFLMGLAGGYFWGLDSDASQVMGKVGSISETEGMRERLVLSLLEQPSANKRLQAVSEANKFDRANEAVINVLLLTLDTDPNTNVRLASIESLANYADDPMVRQGLVRSIANQTSPIVQVTLANLMVVLQEKKSVGQFKKLLEQKGLDTIVKQRIENSIEQII